jgi:hypothetical protein
VSDLIHRSQAAKSRVWDPSLSKRQRLEQALEAFSGLDLTPLDSDVRERLEADLFRVNRVLAPYELEKGEHFRTVSDLDVQRMLDIVETAAAHAIAGELDRIVAELDAGFRRLPVEAIHETREHRDLMVPRLIEVIREAAEAARDGDMPEGNAHFFAVFLLTEFQAEEAFPVILDAFKLPGKLPFDLFGDIVTSVLARILALFAGDRPELFDALIADRNLNKYVRWEGAQAYVHLVRDGRLSRDEAVRRLQQQLRRAIDEEDVELIGGLICVLTSFAPQEAMEDVAEAYRRDLVETFLVDLGFVEESVAEGEDRVRKDLEACPATGIEDTIEVLRRWASFSEKPRRIEKKPAPPPVPPPAPHFLDTLESAEPATVPSRGQRTGRNDPCPCGSGKKFKKCCGARS